MSRGGIILLSALGGFVLLGLVILLVGFGSGTFKLSNLLPPGGTSTEEFRANFIDSSRKSCIRTATANAPSATTPQIASYCDCFATGSADLLTEDDVKYMIDHLGGVPPGLVPRLQPLIVKCRSAAFGK